MNIDDIIENAQLKGRVIGLNAQVETLTAEVRCLEAVVRAHERVDCLIVANLKAEVERLESDLKLEKENEDRLVRLWQTANNEVHGQRAQIAALIDNQARLNSLIANREQEVERLRKAGDELHAFLINYIVDSRISSAYLNKLDDGWTAAKEGKQS